jgi:hypothetical protein
VRVTKLVSSPLTLTLSHEGRGNFRFEYSTDPA